jgi:hypothetical protein
MLKPSRTRHPAVSLVNTVLAAFSISFSFNPTNSQAAGVKVGNGTTKLALIGNPQLNVTVPGMAAKIPRPPAPNESRFWLEFEVDFESGEDFPELTLKYGLLMASPGKNQPRLLEGEVIHVDVTKGKDRHSVMYITPRSLSKLSEGKAFNLQTAVRAQWVEFYAQGELVGRIFKSTAGLTEKQVMDGKDALEKAPEALIHKQATPFGPLFTDYFETFKPTR